MLLVVSAIAAYPYRSIRGSKYQELMDRWIDMVISCPIASFVYKI
ncbi:hypothetical protein [Okeania sp. SIO3B5]|nr:hypothetical protein [Okeania sp. SIO3B5]